MKTATLRRFLDLHTWTGLIAGMALFMAFYAGALVVFQGAIITWQRPELRPLPAPETPARMEALVRQVTAAEPQAGENLWLYLPSPFTARMFAFWREGEDERVAMLDRDGRMHDVSSGSGLAELVNHVHFSLGLPERFGVTLMGVVCILYGLALVSGVVMHLPNLVRDLFALRRGRNLKRMWQDAHNVIGVLSLPFHLVFAFTGMLLCVLVLFIAGLDVLALDRQAAPLYRQASQVAPAAEPRGEPTQALPVPDLLDAARRRAPPLQPQFVNFRHYGDAGGTVNVYGSVPGHLVDYSLVSLAPSDGRVLGVQLPGERNNAHLAIRAVTSLHFGTFGGTAVQWLYFLLGLGGAFLFYSGNLLWIESRRKRRRVEQPRTHRFLARLTVGVCLGCCAGVSAAFVSALAFAGTAGHAGWEWRIYYATFLGCVLWAQWRPPGRAAAELAGLVAALTLAVPIVNAAVTGDHLLQTARSGMWQVFGVDAVAIAMAAGFAWIAHAAARRARDGDPNSVWANPPRAAVAAQRALH